MKKTTFLLLAIFTAFQSWTFAQCPGTPDPGYTCVPDVAFEQALITYNYDSLGVLDGQILTADAIAVTGTFGFSNKGIADLTGLEAFVNLEELNLSYNTGITTLDLSANVNLVELNLEGCSGLSSLNVTGLTFLEEINVYDTALTTVDLLTNTGLLTFNARNASLQSIDFSGNTLLSNVNVRNNALLFIDMRNGNNANTVFRADNNVGPGCIIVDDETESNLVSWNLGELTLYETEGACPTFSTGKTNVVAFSIYPNPASGSINISSNLNQKTKLAVYNITGKLVLSNTISFGENRLNISSLSSGVYLMRVSTPAKTITKKLIIK
ncbi:T9SS type A sorting domain-containing protein [Bizionia argentinensis JUB59]|uniref:T9SS type A sorting domain-containing protein n=1 Tax=Bizionia argentinensis JUB59 TaxID=1046627 RepID=G2EHG1_9FLAO|nr:T9SS type A sorting domain-containing protein [Bizionia argentinensis]EGV42189.1 T9SS type A sorting domain-containing protein [Bizionia argentinensis JUB59]